MAFTEADLTTLRAAAAAALKTYNNARATGAHNDIGGGVIMLRSVVGSTLGGFAGAGGGDYKRGIQIVAGCLPICKLFENVWSLHDNG